MLRRTLLALALVAPLGACDREDSVTDDSYDIPSLQPVGTALDATPQAAWTEPGQDFNSLVLVLDRTLKVSDSNDSSLVVDDCLAVNDLELDIGELHCGDAVSKIKVKHVRIFCSAKANTQAPTEEPREILSSCSQGQAFYYKNFNYPVSFGCSDANACAKP